jgi:hypothetical protein
MEHAGRARIGVFSDYDGTICCLTEVACTLDVDWMANNVRRPRWRPLGKAGVIALPNITPGV